MASNTTSKSTVKTRIFIISDTHSAVDGRDTTSTASFRQPFPKADILLHTGDLTKKGRLEEYRSAIKLLASIPAELKLVIAGNHDLSLDKDYYLERKAPILLLNQQDYQRQNAELAEQIWTGDEAKEAGVTYLTEGYHRFTLSNGAEFGVYASPWQPEFFNWAFNYAHNEDRWNPPELISKEPYLKDRSQNVILPARPGKPIPSDQVDIVMTHGPPWRHLDETHGGEFAGCPQLLQAINRVRPRLHCFGHIHEAWGAEKVIWGEKVESENEDHSAPLGETSESFGKLIQEEELPGIQTPLNKEVIDRRAAYLDVSDSSPTPLKYGLESVLVNSSIMTQRYKPSQAGWLIDLELPLKI